MLGARMVLQDVWDAQVALARIQDEGVHFMMVATPFLADLTDNPALPRFDVSTLDIFISAGAPIPRTLVQSATERLKAHIVSGWGMTENLLVTGTRLLDAPEKVFGTDGFPVPGMEIRVVDAAGQALGVDQEGELQSRGASHFVGYLKRPERYDMDAQGWFKTGDLARIDAEGYVRITDRAKDIIIRGGENVPVVEVEQLLQQTPGDPGGRRGGRAGRAHGRARGGLRDAAARADPDARRYEALPRGAADGQAVLARVPGRGRRLPAPPRAARCRSFVCARWRASSTKPIDPNVVTRRGEGCAGPWRLTPEES